MVTCCVQRQLLESDEYQGSAWACGNKVAARISMYEGLRSTDSKKDIEAVAVGARYD